MELMIAWKKIVWQLRGAFSRSRTFYWAVIVIMGFCTRQDSMGGVSSFIRSIGIRPLSYQRLIDFFHSDAIDLCKLTELWGKAVFKFFQPFLVTLRGCPVFVLDGISIAKEGKKMPGVQSLHQASDSNSKAEYIMGHFFQCIGILAGFEKGTIFSVPLLGRIHLGTKFSNRDKRSLYDKAPSMMKSIFAISPFYLVADSYYAVRKMINGIIKEGGHLISRVKSNAVAYLPEPEMIGKRGRGRPRKYGTKVKLKDLFLDLNEFEAMDSPVYGEKNVSLLVRTIDLLLKGQSGMVKYILVIHPTRGKMILLSTDLDSVALDIIQAYGYRFKIEVAFKAAIYNVGTFLYRFWMSDMEKTHRRQGCKYLHRKSAEYRERYSKKLRAYEIYVQMAFIAQGIMQYLSLAYSKAVWKYFGSWIRTIRPGVYPTEMVVGMALRNCLFYFLKGSIFPSITRKFIREKTDFQEVEHYRMPG